ncbi:MAG: type II toxin-antitoxin system RelE/ParE family toxin [Alphaproteobacteria bacterium]|nr:type II toxin-antitoxin system RelE/ParE family toxin [Alphaproteobacteria bacterium]
MNTILLTPDFSEWLKRLSDPKGKARILARIKSAELGNFGDSKPVGEGVSEMRIDVGPGYRVYFIRDGKTVYVLLGGGNKAAQTRDIRKAIKTAKAWKE